MKTPLRAGLVAVLLAALVALPAAAEEAHVVLVTIDGLAAYHLENEELEIPELRGLIDAGVWAEGSETVFPSVTHPSHTTLITGVEPRVHGVIGNRLRNRLTGERFHITNRPRKQSVRVPTLFDAVKAVGGSTASFWWPETLEDPAIDHNIPEVFTADHAADPSAADPAYLQELRRAGAPIDLFYVGYHDPALMQAADVALARVAAWEIRTRMPRFLAIHLSATDAIQHDYGSDHYLSHAAITTADRCVGILREAVGEAGLAETTTFVVTADHGFHTVRYEVNVRPLLDALGLGDVVALHPDGWTLFVETLEDFDPERHEAALETFLKRVLSLPGVARVVRPEGFHALGFPRYEEDPHVPGQYMILGDVDTFPVDDTGDPRATVRPKRPPYSGHGYLPGHPRMYPALVLAGRGIKRGARIGHVRHLDVTATLAHLLGVDLPDLPGRVIGEALLSPPTPLTRGSGPPDR